MLLKNISFSSSFCCSVNVYFRRIRLLFHEYNTFFSHSEVINASPSSSSLLSFSSSSSSPPLLLLLFFYGVSFSCKLLFFFLLGLVSLKVEVLLSCLVILDCSLWRARSEKPMASMLTLSRMDILLGNIRLRSLFLGRPESHRGAVWRVKVWLYPPSDWVSCHFGWQVREEGRRSQISVCIQSLNPLIQLLAQRPSVLPSPENKSPVLC